MQNTIQKELVLAKSKMIEEVFWGDLVPEECLKKRGVKMIK